MRQRERDSRAERRGRGGNRLLEEQGTERGAWSQDPEIMTWAEGRHFTDWATQETPFFFFRPTSISIFICRPIETSLGLHAPIYPLSLPSIHPSSGLFSLRITQKPLKPQSQSYFAAELIATPPKKKPKGTFSSVSQVYQKDTNQAFKTLEIDSVSLYLRALKQNLRWLIFIVVNSVLNDQIIEAQFI